MQKKKRFPVLTLALVGLIMSSLCIQPPMRVQAASPATDKTKEAVVLYVNSPVAYVNNKQTFIDPEDLTIVPIVKDSRTLVPLRFISEAFGAKVDWNETKQQATIQYDEHTVTFTMGSNTFIADGETLTMDTTAEVINDRAYIPLRSLATAIGKEAFYDRGLIIISDTKNIFDPVADKEQINELISMVNNLPVVGSKENWNKLMSDYDDMYNPTAETSDGSTISAPAFDTATASTSESASAKAPTAGKQASGDYSTTNVQVEGVDEADIVKTDGTYIYYIHDNYGKKNNVDTLYSDISIVKAVPAENMTIEDSVKFESEFSGEFKDENFSPSELYIDNNYMVVIGTSYTNVKREGQYIEPYTYTKAITYDTSDKKNVKQVREVSAPGYAVSSRKIGTTVYLITNDYAAQTYRPQYEDTAVSKDKIFMDYQDICYFPDSMSPQFTTVTGFDMTKPSQEAIVNSYLGAGENIYMSTDNLYIASVDYGINTVVTDIDSMVKRPVQTTKTAIYKFALNKGDVTYQYKNTVPGTIINQFAMDEYDDNFRIATTSHDSQYNPTNNLYVLDEVMNIVGKIENIAPGETIYSTRFMEDRAYMVTYRTVDPLFVIDLKDPKNPSILGALKIPGYSNYLHPYDKNHIIGFGKDTIEKDGNAYTKGMKISMFDVTDVNNPKEMFTEYIGDRGTESPVFYEHKTLMFSKEKNLMAFPVQVAEVKPENKADELADGQIVFQGAYVYNVDLINGFVKKGEVTHLSKEDIEKVTRYDETYYDDSYYSRQIERILYIGDNLYTLSKDKIQANVISDLAYKSEVAFE